MVCYTDSQQRVPDINTQPWFIFWPAIMTSSAVLNRLLMGCFLRLCHVVFLKCCPRTLQSWGSLSTLPEALASSLSASFAAWRKTFGFTSITKWSKHGHVLNQRESVSCHAVIMGQPDYIISISLCYHGEVCFWEDNLLLRCVFCLGGTSSCSCQYVQLYSLQKKNTRLKVWLSYT